MRRGLAVLLLLLAGPAAGQSERPYARTSVERVPISITFTGRDIFLFGQVPPGSNDVAVVVEGPPAGAVRLMRKGRVVVFWLGVRQYELTRVPSLYLVNLHCPLCNGLARCPHPADLHPLNAALGALDEAVGPGAVAERAELASRGGRLEPGEKTDVVGGYWKLQESRGLYGVRPNAIRIGPRGFFYHVVHLPTEAPEGRYRVATTFLQAGRVVALAENQLLVRKFGLVGWLSRMAERRAVTYGVLTVGIAVATGFLAGSLFRRGAKH